MRRIVIDASLLLAMLFPDEQSSAAVEIFEQYRAGTCELTAPELINLEVLNACLTALRRGRISEDVYERITSTILKLDIRLAMNKLTEVEALARKHGLSAYDSAYLTVAVKEKCHLATLEEKLINSARAEGLPSRTP